MTDAVFGLIGVVFGVVATVIAQYLFARQDRYHQLRMAALDRRLAAHQEAYSLWIKLLHAGDDPDAAFECQFWWPDNCLYLSPKASKAFQTAYQAAFLRANLPTPQTDVKLLERNWSKINEAGPIIASAVGLPNLVEPKEKTPRGYESLLPS